MREIEGEYEDYPEPGNEGVLIRRYDGVKLYGLSLSTRGKKGQHSAEGDPPREAAPI